jgi:hypothetical protein
MTTTTTDIVTTIPAIDATQTKPRLARKSAGKAATGSKAAPVTMAEGSPPPSGTAVATAAPERISRTDQLIAMLRTADGVSIEDLSERFGWLPHSARAALTGLRKRGLDVERSKAGTVTVYRIAAA